MEQTDKPEVLDRFLLGDWFVAIHHQGVKLTAPFSAILFLFFAIPRALLRLRGGGKGIIYAREIVVASLWANYEVNDALCHTYNSMPNLTYDIE